MNVSAIDALLAQMRAAVAVAEGKAPMSPAASGPQDFSSVLKSALDQVAQTQNQATSLENRFAAGDPQVSLSDTMISMQKATIALQATVQARDRVVSAYNDIMNMQI